MCHTHIPYCNFYTSIFVTGFETWKSRTEIVPFSRQVSAISEPYTFPCVVSELTQLTGPETCLVKLGPTTGVQLSLSLSLPPPPSTPHSPSVFPAF